MMVQRRQQSGFTLIEVMLVIAIISVMASLVWASFSLSTRTKRKAEAISERYHQIRLAMERMTREISMAFLSKNDIPGAMKPRTFFTSKHQSSVDELTFASLSHMRLREDAREGDQTLISYYSAPDVEDRSRTNLMRRATRRLGVEKPGEDGPAYVMLEDVEELHFEFFDVNANEWREQWNTGSVDGQPDRLPTKVRIVITIKDEKGKDITFHTATRIHLRDPLWFSPDQ
ncbi:MAG: prepilin-type N-terminal cleavage/methylation domain-containing protein [Deltaproteobacteria bacterium]|nr:prepilin-type N-terminal cleavage/methylation domain-containing protein [Deltaproteobacteria bacterium]